jgi:hypothetical protein
MRPRAPPSGMGLAAPIHAAIQDALQIPRIGFSDEVIG